MNTDLKNVLCIDPVVDVEESYSATEVVYKSGVNKSVYTYSADSFSDQNWIWNNITPPSLTTVTKRSLRVKYSILVANVNQVATNQPILFNAVNTAGAPAPQGTNQFFGCVPRAFPVANSASQIELRLNGSATSVGINDYACVYPHLMTNEDAARWSAEMPIQKDDSSAYSSPNTGNANGSGAPFDNRSPFSSYGANPIIPTRASYVWRALANGTATGTVTGNVCYVYQLDITEELLISPMVWGSLMDISAGLCNLNNLILNIRFQDINRMISAIPYGAGNQVYVTCTNNLSALPAVGQTGSFSASGTSQIPTLLVEYITQDPILAARLPQTVVYDYSLIQTYITPGGNWVNTTAPVTNAVLQSLRLASIPSKLMVFARPSKSALNTAALAQQTPDTFLRITGVQISFNNRVNLLSTYTEADLFNMSVKNGLQDDFNTWRYQSGSLLIVDVARDLGLESDETAGQSNKYSTLQIQVSFSASPLAYAAVAGALPYDFYILVEQPGKAFMNASECQYILTGPSASTVLSLTSNLDQKIDHTDLEGKGVGGSVFSKIGNLFKSGIQHLKKVNPEHIAKGVEIAQKGLSALGLGVSGGSVAGGAMKGRHSRVY